MIDYALLEGTAHKALNKEYNFKKQKNLYVLSDKWLNSGFPVP